MTKKQIEEIKCELAKFLYGHTDDHTDDMWSLPYADHAVVDFLAQRGCLTPIRKEKKECRRTSKT